jgi:hypothetical protein
MCGKNSRDTKENIMVIPTHRKVGRLTLEQFREHKENGIGIREMPKLFKVSKNHVQFLSALDQGKFDNITSDIFYDEYIKGMSLFEIADKHNISREYIGFLREHFDIDRLGAKFINRKKTEKCLTQRQKDIIYGTLMGDGGKMSPSSLKIKQSTKQREYAIWKFNELQEHVSLKSLQDESSLDVRYGKIYENVRFYTNANTEIESIIKAFYPQGAKKIDETILNCLTSLSVAVWFMDDGTTNWCKRLQNPGINVQPSSQLCTDSFSFTEVELICRWFNERWNINCKPKIRNKTKWRVMFPTTETPKLFALIRPHMHPSLLYKIDYDEYLKKIG